MFDPKSDYALNKMAPDAIVYKDAAGDMTRLTQADFPSLEEFQRWKAWSDENYHDTEKASHIYSAHRHEHYAKKTYLPEGSLDVFKRFELHLIVV